MINEFNGQTSESPSFILTTVRTASVVWIEFSAAYSSASVPG